jgi:DNA-binding XRE family transcriptional regulator
MTHISYVRTPGGEELAILPRAELEQMIVAVNHAKALADYRSGRDPGLTADEMRELLAASSPLAFWRRKRGLTQAQLAKEAGVAQNYVSDLERGKREGSPVQWLRIARILRIPIEDLIDD